jgi:hypothetical protein
MLQRTEDVQKKLWEMKRKVSSERAGELGEAAPWISKHFHEARLFPCVMYN